ncbi:MAG TPA: ABC transporter substrate-binding protein [Chloroflexota bacterium]|nr:ABC transporter substrate-binding protein [Chloroflexota bacterium]
MLRHRSKRLLTFLGVTALVLPTLVGHVSAASPAASLKVSILGQWGSAEKTDFQAILSYCAAHYHTNTTYIQSGSDLNAQLSTMVQGNNAPDIATLSTPSSIAPYVQGGSLQPLTFLNTAKFRSQYSPFWINLGTISGKLYALYMKADVKSLVWYSPAKFKAGHYEIPKTWTQLISLSQKMVKDGKQPWAFGIDTGWPLTDFLENIYLSAYGPTMYNQWIAGKIKWTDPSIKHAFQLFDQIIGNNAMIAGGRTRALGQKWDQGAVQMVTDPKAMMFQEASFVGAGLAGDLPKAVEGKDYTNFPFPMIKMWPTTPVEVGPNGMVMFHDTPGARALLTCMTDPNALAQWAKLGGYISPNNAVPASAYKDALTSSEADLLAKAGKANLLVGDASDLMPVSFGSGYEFTALEKYFQNPSMNLDSFLSDMQSHAARAYAQGH